MRKLFSFGAETHGKGKVLFKWSPGGAFLATCGVTRKVYVWDRNGRLYDEVHLPSPEEAVTKKGKGEELLPACTAMEWDSTGDQLAMLPKGVSHVLLYHQPTRETKHLDTSMKELCFLSWAHKEAVLAVGTARGNVLLYNDKQGRKIPIMGKHTKKIVSGCWSVNGRLALGSEDKQVTISNMEGDTTKQQQMRGVPLEMMFADKKKEGKAEKTGNTVSVNVSGSTIFLFKATDDGDDKTPVELSFQDRYGEILAHQWFGDGYIVLGFASGYVVVMSTHNAEITEEVHSAKYLRGALTSLAYSPTLDRAAMCGGNQVKVLSLTGQEYTEIKEDALEFDVATQLDRLSFTPDGQVLTVSSNGGEVHAFLAALPTLHAAHQARMVYLTSLLELSVVDVLTEQRWAVTIDAEPAFMALGPAHLATGMNNQVWVYRIGEAGVESERVNQRDYLGAVTAVVLNETHAAVLTEGRVQLHLIEEGAGGHGAHEDDVLFPDKGQANDITCVGLAGRLMMLGTKRGTLQYWMVDHTRALVNEYRHADGGIVRLFPNTLGTRLLFVDSQSAVHLYNPVNDQVLPVPSFSMPLEFALWDTADANCVMLADATQFYVFVYSPVSIAGPLVQLVGTTPRPHGFNPAVLYNGVVTCQLKSGALENLMLGTHTALQATDARVSLERMRRRFTQHLALLHLTDAWHVALQLKMPEVWEALCEAALTHMDVELAVRCYRLQGNAGMVLALEKVAGIEDKNLLAGHIAVLLEQDYDAAQELFLKSTRPVTALEMRKDLKHWDQAMKLAGAMAPEALPDISRQYGAQLEMKGDHNAALQCYDRALEDGRASLSEAAVARCEAGIARCSLHAGDLHRGRQLCIQRGEPGLFRECAQILEALQQTQDAGELYERGGQLEKAAALYIQGKLFNRASPLMAHITTPKLHSLFARAKEAEGRYEEAAAAYDRAKDTDNVVRVLLTLLDAPQKAFALVRKTRSATGADKAAKHCLAAGKHAMAVEFLLLARREREAFELAEVHNEMDTYVQCLGNRGTPDDYRKLAAHYEGVGQFATAGGLHEKCHQYAAALKLYLRAGASEIDRAIAVVGRAQSDVLTNQLVDYLMGETDGVAKDHNYLFRLHMALGQYTQAASTAVAIARQEQELGNYKLAHSQLLDTCRELTAQSKRVPAELTRQLLLLHSYVLVKTLVKFNDHAAAARMLVRVAKSISKFPRHVVPILTSTVIECQRSGLKSTAFEYASMLMRPEYRNHISDQYRAKIEKIVRKPEKVEEEEPTTACPFCHVHGPETELECTSCKNVIPYCIATGRRMVLGDWAHCPACRFPARASVFVKLVAADRQCPMCHKEVQLSQIRKVDDPLTDLREAAAAVEAAEKEEAAARQAELESQQRAAQA